VNQVLGTQTFFNGYFREDYEYVPHAGDPTYLDVHNGRFCITPEYPNGIYCYFATVDANHNSAYPYVVGPTFYGTVTTTTVTTIPAGTTAYDSTLAAINFDDTNYKVVIAPNPASDFVAIQTPMTMHDMKVDLIDALGKIVQSKTIVQGSTLCVFETDTVYDGIYFIKITDGSHSQTTKVVVKK
jgi:hypothetical protein